MILILARLKGSALLQRVTLDGDLDLLKAETVKPPGGNGVTANWAVHIQNGATLNGTMHLNMPDIGAVLAFTGSKLELQGSGEVVFGSDKNNGLGTFEQPTRNDSPITIGPGLTVRGANFTIGPTFLFTGPRTYAAPLLNKGSIRYRGAGRSRSHRDPRPDFPVHQ